MATSLNLASLDGKNGFRLVGNPKDYSGFSVSSAGDVNGDGFDDSIIGSSGYYGYYANEFIGSSYVVFGKASDFSSTLSLSDLDGSNGFRLEGDASSFSVSTAGDVNGDGFDDVIVDSGQIYVVFGKTSGFNPTFSLSDLDGSNGFRLEKEVEDNSQFVRSVSNAGDVNGDGFDDVIVGIGTRDDLNGLISGSSYVIFGQASGFDDVINLSSLDGSNGFRLDGVAGDQSGRSVSNAGDVNGDGFDDVIIGAWAADPNGNYSGSSYVIFGQASGFDDVMNLSSLDGSNGFRLDGEKRYDNSGYSVSYAGDVNGDGFDDVIIGATGANTNAYNTGASYVVFGKASGFEAALNLASLDGSNGFRLDGEAASNGLGFSVSNAGDVNGDGFDDLIVGAPDSYPNGVRLAGSSYVVFGKASEFDATLNLSSLDGNNGFRLDGVTRYDDSGYSVSYAGDVNGDGFDDVLVGAPGANAGYIIFGRSDFGNGGGGELPEIPGTPGDDVLRGTSVAELFEAGNGNDVLIGGGGADVFRGGAGVDQIKIPDLNFESIDGGAGDDILHLAGTDLNLDLTAFGDNINGIETICLYGRGDNSLVLTANSVLALSDTSNTLKLHGNDGDRVTVQDDGWVDEGLRGGGYYHVYTNEDAVLLVGANVAVEFV